MSVIDAGLAGADLGNLASGFSADDFAEDAPRRRSSGRTRAEKSAQHEREGHLRDLYQSSKEGLPRPEHLDDEERAAWDEGERERRQGRRSERADKARRAASSGTGVAKQAAGYLGSVASAPAAPVPGGFDLSPWGVLAGILGLIALYLFLARSSLASKAVSGLVSGARWLISTEPLPV